jgi:hypothetical protein
MLAWVIQISIVSFIFIFLVHHLIGFFKTTLTVPKIKDLVNSPSQKYQHIFDTINTNTNSYTKLNTDNSNSNSYTAIDLLPSSDFNASPKDTMKDELKSFLKKQLNNSEY